MPVKNQRGELIYLSDNWRLGTDVADVVRGDFLMPHPTELGLAQLATGPTVRFLSVVAEPYGGGASLTEEGPGGVDAIPQSTIHGRDILVHLLDDETIVHGDPLMMNAGGTVILATTGKPIVAISQETVSSGTTDQFIRANVGPVGLGLAP